MYLQQPTTLPSSSRITRPGQLECMCTEGQMKGIREHLRDPGVDSKIILR